MKITDEQAQRLYEVVKSFVAAYEDGADCSWLKQFQATIVDIAKEIEAANQPKPIRWCVSHDEYVLDSMLCCQHESIYPKTICDIWIFSPTERVK